MHDPVSVQKLHARCNVLCKAQQDGHIKRVGFTVQITPQRACVYVCMFVRMQVNEQSQK